MLIAAVVELHGDEHRCDPRHRPGKLAKKKGVAGAVPLFSNYSRCAEHHHQADKHQAQGDSEQPAIGADTFCHEDSFHHGDTRPQRFFAANLCRKVTLVVQRVRSKLKIAPGGATRAIMVPVADSKPTTPRKVSHAPWCSAGSDL